MEGSVTHLMNMKKNKKKERKKERKNERNFMCIDIKSQSNWLVNSADTQVDLVFVMKHKAYCSVQMLQL